MLFCVLMSVCLQTMMSCNQCKDCKIWGADSQQFLSIAFLGHVVKLWGSVTQEKSSWKLSVSTENIWRPHSRGSLLPTFLQEQVFDDCAIFKFYKMQFLHATPSCFNVCRKSSKCTWRNMTEHDGTSKLEKSLKIHFLLQTSYMGHSICEENEDSHSVLHNSSFWVRTAILLFSFLLY